MLFVIARDIGDSHLQRCYLFCSQLFARGRELGLGDFKVGEINLVQFSRELFKCRITIFAYFSEYVAYRIHGVLIGCHSRTLQHAGALLG